LPKAGLGRQDMYLEGITVDRYRSIDSIELSPCGDFNVLIGKNNSGKSNILSSIEAFFSCLSSEIVTTGPSIGAEIDFFKKDTDTLIIIKGIFTMSEKERSDLFTEIANERPQLRSVIETIKYDIKLAITIHVHSPPQRYSYVNNISLVQPRDTHTVDKTLFNVDAKAATALYLAVVEIEKIKLFVRTVDEFLGRFDEDDFQNNKAINRETRLTIDYYLRTQPTRSLDAELGEQIKELFRAANSYPEFRAAVLQLSANEEAKIMSILERPLPTSITTFSGDEAFVPSYVKTLLQKLSELKVLHFKERRKAIGPEEARRLLRLKVRRGGRETLERLQETIHELLGVKVDAYEGQSRTRGTEQDAELDVDDFLVQVNGSGIREALRLILDTEFDSPDILLVEEPEIHLHPALETSVMH
jgi:putative ATP-dependent endonuclease of OLD family